MRKLVLPLLAVLISACAPKLAPTPAVTTPKFPDFVQPAMPADTVNSPAGRIVSRGWAYLQTGDLKAAEREFAAALAAAPRLTAADTSLGYVELARKDPKAALPHFDRALEAAPADVSALLGRGQALVAMTRDAEAIAAFEAALAVDPSLADVRRRVEVLRFRGAEQKIARARELARQGQVDEALQAYGVAIASSPESPFLYREIAPLEQQQGNVEAALADFRKAVALDPTDARSLVHIGEILEAKDDLAGAEQSYADALAIEPNDDVEKRLDAVRERIALARLPAEYRAIDEAPQVTRGDVAALLGIRLAAVMQQARRDAVLVTDVRSHWAATWIMSVARTGIMEPFANHTFQPRAIVRRSDLAQIVARVLTRVGPQQSVAAQTWQSARLKFTDLSPTHLAYPAASIAVAAGVMKTTADGAFQPGRPVTGAEAIEAVERLEALAESR